MESGEIKPWNDEDRLSESIRFMASLVASMELTGEASWRRRFKIRASEVAETSEPLSLRGALAGILLAASEDYLRWKYYNPRDTDESDPEAALIDMESAQTSILEAVKEYSGQRM